MRKHGKMGRFGQVNRITGQKMVILSGLKRGLDQSGCGLGWVGLTCIFHMDFFFFNYKKNMYLPFGKSCNKLLDVKCITLNSPLISKMNYTF